ncbi:polysaccharide pyruvyl transferase WcaK-like protein [Dyadobacter sp. BE34]|uniref:Polysaccharide pyruvyl transferase WcaK-like protein n=1 Tax=Dyadobacter fermentans TaxID=94254 RepID=A0ABU1R0S4_9BACT|nr:polysaccharide pyruvyl transferase WcaK-like protein [Dyadobacter fermentans]MDR7044594.1 polysaccharide pyruvyl transferase WcaK-like protein [Dyadobacter sp. BE242]MDR7198904.1 polysaccharide pyruvyl transferase WcaK-like protein [Dyadobacter sp. BE34]MDR7216866.1 polysaccharide pyruvyl transferase WcaK-like protein [Dyadobacter sp. BE31]MDR7263608.1 polysaccharide pyruvyl transferase WcaK-like protein [Dyadobacter sp. BE32]
MKNRRDFIKNAAALAGVILLGEMAQAKADPTILFVSGWQDVNIGDIAHTPGLIALLKKRLPKAKLILWKKSKSDFAEGMLKKHYPDLQIIHGQVSKEGEPQSDEVRKAFATADFFLHGSGPSVVAADYLDSWQKQTQKPFGIFGVTIQDVTPDLKRIIQNASFIFTRETASIAKLKEAGLEGKHIAFAPDATFAMDIHDDAAAAKFISDNKLTDRKFICVIPRLRRTPYYKIRPNNAGWSPERIREVDELNDKWKEIDHAKLREAMVAWVRKTKGKVVVCPEMTYQLDVMDELLINPLPDDIKPYIVKHGYWLPDEAASLYKRAQAVLSFECHSPIIAAANGTPCFYLRQPEDTIKGQMYYDLGLADWTFEIEQTNAKQITERLLEVNAGYNAALKKVQAAMSNVRERYNAVFTIVGEKV